MGPVRVSRAASEAVGFAGAGAAAPVAGFCAGGAGVTRWEPEF